MRDIDIEVAQARIATYRQKAFEAQEQKQHLAASQWEDLARIEQDTLRRRIAHDKEQEDAQQKGFR